MKSLPVVVATLFATLLAFSVVPAAFANDMNAVLVPQVDKGETHFIAVKNITFRYPADSAIAQELNGKQDRIQFTVSGNSSSTDNGVASAITAFNRALLQAQSPAMVTNMTITMASAANANAGLSTTLPGSSSIPTDTKNNTANASRIGNASVAARRL